MRAPDDLARELEKVTDAVDAASRHFALEAEMNAVLHMSPTVRPAPLAVAVQTASEDLHRLIAELREPAA